MNQRVNRFTELILSPPHLNEWFSSFIGWFQRASLPLSLRFYVSRPGLEMSWVVRPPETVKVGEVFSVTYSVTARNSFYDWAVQNHIFTNRSVILVNNWSNWFKHKSSPKVFMPQKGGDMT